MEKQLLKKKSRSEDQNDWQKYIGLCERLGSYYNEQGEYEKALAEYRNMADKYNLMGKEKEQASAHRMMGEMHMLLCEYESAVREENVHLKCAIQMGDKVEMQRGYATIGRIYLLQAQSSPESTNQQALLKNAERAFFKSLMKCKELTVGKTELNDMMARLYLNLGVTKENLNDLKESKVYYDKAIDISEKCDLFELLHQCYFTKSQFLHSKQKYSRDALSCLNLALETASRLSDKAAKMCETLMAKSKILIEMDDFQSAKQVLQKAYKLKTPNEDDRKEIERSLKALATLCYSEDSLIATESTNYAQKKRLYEKMGDASSCVMNFSRAIDYYLKMLDNAKELGERGRQLLPIYVSLYQTYKDNKEYDKSLTYLWMEHEIIKDCPEDLFNTLCIIGEIYELLKKDFSAIDNIYGTAKNEAKKCNNLRFQKIVFKKLYNLRKKFDQSDLNDELIEEAKQLGIYLEQESYDSESEDVEENNTPALCDDIDLDDLTDNASDVEDTDKPRQSRTKTSSSIMKKNEKGETQLHTACISGNTALVKRLLEHGHPTHVRDNAGWLPLHEACNYGHTEVVKLLLEKGDKMSINDKGGACSDGITPLYDACVNGCLEVAELLLDRGANPSIKTDAGQTPLYGLQQWRQTARLEPDEQIFYETLKARISQSLKQSGMSAEDLLKSATKVDSNNLTGLSRRTATITTLCSDDSDQDLGYSAGTSRQRNGTTKRTARNDYKDTMQMLRRGKKSTPSYINDEIAAQLTPVEKITKFSGILSSQDVGDNWLDNDIEQPKKKTKFFNEHFYSPKKAVPVATPSSANKSKRTPVKSPAHSNNNSFQRIKSNDRLSITHHEIRDDSSEDSSRDAFDVIMGAKPSLSKKRRRNSSTSSSARSRSNSMQTNMKRHISVTKTSVNTSSSPHKVNLMMDNEFVNLEAPVIARSQITVREDLVTAAAAPYCVTIKVEEVQLLIPVQMSLVNDLTIKWLADEAARRYYNLKGVRPTLRLMTSTGAIFEDDDTIAATMSTNFLTTNVLKWSIPPLGQRFVEICNNLKIAPNNRIKQTLEYAETSKRLELENSPIALEHATALFQTLAINNQCNLVQLNLSGSFLKDDGIKLLARSLSSFRNLQDLDISCNFVTGRGLFYINYALKQDDTTLRTLIELNLSYNPIQDAGVLFVNKILQQLDGLKVLNLCSTDLVNCDLGYLRNLKNLNVAFNNLTPHCVQRINLHLNKSLIEEMNFSFCSKSLEVGYYLSNALTSASFCGLNDLDLSGCGLSDNDVIRILASIANKSQLRRVNLSQNSSLTQISLQFVFKHKSLKTILLEGCPNILVDFILDDLTLIEDGFCPLWLSFTFERESCRVQIEALTRFWKRLWQEKHRIEIVNTKLILRIDVS